MKPDVSALIGREGKYSNHKSDTGGETMWGITISVARANGYTGEMRAMTRAVAEGIYLDQYWYKPKFSLIAELSELIAEELFDTGVNMGIGKASEFLQITLNALNKGATIYPDIKEDGQIGSVTIEMLRRFLNARGKEGEKVMLTALNCLQGARYIDLSRGRAANEDFVYGWILHRVNT
jgi:lysozyme family protein